MPPWNVCVSRASGLGMVWWVSFLSRADGTVSEHLRLCSSALCACLVQVLKVLSLAVCLSAAGALARLWRWVLVFVGVSGFVPLLLGACFPASARLWSGGLVPRCGYSGTNFVLRVLSECPSGARVGLFRSFAGSSPPHAAG